MVCVSGSLSLYIRKKKPWIQLEYFCYWVLKHIRSMKVEVDKELDPLDRNMTWGTYGFDVQISLKHKSGGR